MTNTNVTTDPRAEYVAGLRMLADLLEANPELNLPEGEGPYNPLTVAVFGDSEREQLASWARLLPGKKHKEQGGKNGELLRVRGSLRGLHLKLLCERDAVCRKVVVGTETVTKRVKDPALLAEVPEVEVTEEVEIVDYQCGSILGAHDDELAGASA